MPVKLGEREPLALNIGQRLLIRALEAASDQPVLRLARVELPAAPLGLILDALNSEELQVPALGVVGLELIDRRRGRVHAGRGDRLEERVDDGAIEPQPADRLADHAGRLRLIRALAQVCVGATVRA